MSNQYASNAVPLPFRRLISERAASRVLPLPFNRPLGYVDTAEIIPTPPAEDKPKPYQLPSGYAAVSQGWGMAYSSVQLAAVCVQTAWEQNGINSSLNVVYEPVDDISACLGIEINGMQGLGACSAAQNMPSEALHGCHAVSVSAMDNLAVCETPQTTAAEALRHCVSDDTSALSAAPRYGCTEPHISGSDGVGVCVGAFADAALPLSACRQNQTLPALNVPCEWYEIPIEPVPDDSDKTYVCGVRPPSNRMALRFQRQKIQHAANSVPLPFACFDVQSIPILKGYIMQNTVTAFSDGIELGLFSASFTCDTGGYCWQGSLTISPDDFAKLNMDGRAKGNEAVITVKINGNTFVIMAEDYSDNRQFGQKSYTVTGRSLTAKLGEDYADKGDSTYSAPMYAAQIATEQIRHSGFEIKVWQIADWLIPSGVYAATDKAPMAVLQELASAAGGFVCSDTALPELRFYPKWRKAAWEVAEATPDVSIPASVIFKISGNRNVAERANGVYVWSTHNAGKAGDIYRQGSDREPRAAALSNALYTDQPVLLAAGIAALSATGTHKKETVTLPVSDKYAIPLAGLGEIWRINEPSGAFQGVVTGVTLEVSLENDAPQITQSVVLDRYLDQ